MFLQGRLQQKPMRYKSHRLLNHTNDKNILNSIGIHTYQQGSSQWYIV